MSAPLRLLHTADWHLGHVLHDQQRAHEHGEVLRWLLGVLAEEEIDALIIAGDIFDTANPPNVALRMWYRFLAKAKKARENLTVVVVSGNHDSPGRLVAPHPVLREMGITIVGSVSRRSREELDTGRLVVSLRNRDGEIAALCGAVPFLRQSDLPWKATDETADALIEGVRETYRQVWETLKAARKPGQGLILTGHCYMRGGSLSELSERKILGGNQHALPVDIFPEEVSYVALGHLHRPQAVGQREEVRYSGSPLPLSVKEADYPHQVRLVVLQDGELIESRSIRCPRPVEFLRLPTDGPETPAEVLPLLQELPEATDSPRETWPYLEVHVRLEAPAPGLQEDVRTALAGKAVRLLRLSAEVPQGTQRPSFAPKETLMNLTPEDVFRRLYEKRHPDSEIEPKYLEAFHELLDAANLGE